MLGGGNEFRCGGGSGSTQVGDEVRNREVSFVADGGDDGDLRAAMARASDSLLKGARSSRDPPPRASTMTSTSRVLLNQAMPALISSVAESPWTSAG